MFTEYGFEDFDDGVRTPTIDRKHGAAAPQPSFAANTENLPTLFRPGKLVSVVGGPSQSELDKWVPVEYIIDWFNARRYKAGLENRVLILKSQTASGKSTALPPELYLAFVKNADQPRNIICTQPRILTAIGNVMQIVNDSGPKYNQEFRIGDNIGWSTQYNKFKPKSFGVLSATLQTLVQMLKSLTDEELMMKYQFILVDETHERDLSTDLAISMLKALVLRNAHNPMCPYIVFMSATFEPMDFLSFFGLSMSTNFIWCAGSSYPIAEMWDWNEGRTINNYFQAAAQLVTKITLESPAADAFQADILIFMPGSSEFKQTIEAINKELKQLPTGVMSKSTQSTQSVAPISSSANAQPSSQPSVDDNLPIVQVLSVDGEAVKADAHDYTAAMASYVKGMRRRVILGTNVAETGVTLNQLKFVIDSGYNKETEFNPIHGIRGLMTKPAPMSRITQRRGRCGRKFPGVFYPLYPKYIFDMLQPIQYPAILVDDPTSVIMSMIYEHGRISAKSFHIDRLDAITPPTVDSSAYSIEKLYALGFVSPHGVEHHDDLHRCIRSSSNEKGKFGLTKMGYLANKLSLLPELARMVFSGYVWQYSIMDLITISAYLTVGSRGLVDKTGGSSSGNHDGDGGSGDNSIKRKNKIVTAVDWDKIYADCGIADLTPIVVGDSFIHGLALFTAATKHVTTLATVRDWCLKYSVNYNYMIKFLTTRENLITEFISWGFNILYAADFSIMKGPVNLHILRRLKKCILDGFRCNLLTKSGGIYYTRSGAVVKSPVSGGPVDDTQMKHIVYYELGLRKNFKKMGEMLVTASHYSIMSGYVGVDTTFL